MTIQGAGAVYNTSNVHPETAEKPALRVQEEPALFRLVKEYGITLEKGADKTSGVVPQELLIVKLPDDGGANMFKTPLTEYVFVAGSHALTVRVMLTMSHRILQFVEPFPAT